ncbi:calcium-binding protein [Dapis sp. BLCC M229]|uniref:calcium-binding protein n=1 Tax=Dapis sp. BLCC M229 TaxID=3400188 RepID=UPI003CE7D25F
MTNNEVWTWDDIRLYDMSVPALNDIGTKNISGYFNNNFQAQYFFDSNIQGNDTIFAGADGFSYHSKIIGSDTNDTIDGNGNQFSLGFAEVNRYANSYRDQGIEIKITQLNDDISGGGGDDVIRGHKGDDSLKGNVGNDEIWGHEGNDSLVGGAGDDIFFGGVGSDIIKGDDGLDTSFYIHSSAGITVDLTNKPEDSYVEVADDGFGGKDRLYSIENIVGSDYDDKIAGDNNPNVLASAKGDDLLTGNGGGDTFILSNGKNTITDFNPSEDKIQIDVEAYYNNNQSVDFDATHSDTDNTLTISVAGQQAAILENISSSQVADALQKIEFIGQENNTIDSDTDNTNISFKAQLAAMHENIFSFEENISSSPVVDTLPIIEFIREGEEENTIVIANNTIVIGDDDSNTGLGASSSSQYIYGGGSADSLRALSGKDVLLGGDGDDFLGGSYKGDILIGGTGADTFALYSFGGWGAGNGGLVRNTTPDSIMDFTAAEGDKINILKSHFAPEGLGSLSDLSFENNELSVNATVIAMLQNQSGFDLNTHVELY